MTVVYVDGRNGVTFDDAIRSLRAGDEIAVVRLADLAANRRELRKRIDIVHSKRCSITETATGRNSRRKGAIAMVLDATEILTHAGKGHDPEKARQFGSRGGRPRKDRGVTDKEAEGHWFDMRHATNTDALKHMGKWTENAAWRKWGASGRQTGPRRKLPAKPRPKR